MASRFVDILLEFRLLVKVVIPMEHLGLVGRSVRRRGSLHDPGNHYILRITFVPTSTAAFLFQGPSIDQRSPTRRIFGSRFQRTQDLANSLDPSFRSGQVVDDSNRDGEVEKGIGMWEVENIGYDG